MAETGKVITLQALKAGYQNKPLLNEVDASLKENQLVLLVGANGKGKSTLLKTISGHLPVIDGTVRMNDLPLEELSLIERARRITFLPAKLEVTQDVKVSDLLEFARIPYLKRLKGLSEEDHRVIERVVNDLGISMWLDKSYNHLSDGERQVVNIARCLVQETQLIILDEPTAHLDIVNKHKVFKLLKEQCKNGKSIICATHDIYQGYDWADGFWLIDSNAAFRTMEKAEVNSVDALIKALF